MTPTPDGRRGAYRRFFAWLMARLSPRLDRELAPRKRALMNDLRGTVVEIGAGTGANLSYLDAATRYIAVEPNRYMHAYLAAAASARGVEIDIRVGTAEALPVPDGSADVVLSTLVLCSVDDVAQALAEVRRVLRRGGRFVFVEHVGAPGGTTLRRWQDRLRPLWKKLGDGCEPDRELAALIQGAGFEQVDIEPFELDGAAALVRPHIAGIAVRGG